MAQTKGRREKGQRGRKKTKIEDEKERRRNEEQEVVRDS